MFKFYIETADLVVQCEIDATMLFAVTQILIGLAGLITSCNISADLMF